MPPPGDFMQGFRADPPSPRFPDAAATPASWSPGQTAMMVPMMCCPECSSRNIGPRDNGESELVRGWQCHRCAARWKLPRQDVVRGYSLE